MFWFRHFSQRREENIEDSSYGLSHFKRVSHFSIIYRVKRKEKMEKRRRVEDGRNLFRHSLSSSHSGVHIRVVSRHAMDGKSEGIGRQNSSSPFIFSTLSTTTQRKWLVELKIQLFFLENLKYSRKKRAMIFL